MAHTPGALCRVPIDERIDRVASRIARGVYTHCAADYANGGVVLFDEQRLAKDLGLSIEQTREILNTTPREGLSGWTLSHCPTSQEVLCARAALAKLEGRE